MARSIPDKFVKVESLRRRKVETTYEYVPVIGQILGYWRVQKRDRIGEDFELHISTPLEKYDRLIVNGEKIEIPRKDAVK